MGFLREAALAAFAIAEFFALARRVNSESFAELVIDND
jgi:hypothetical protein